MDWFLLYLILKLDALSALFVVGAVISVSIAIVFWVIGASAKEYKDPEYVASNFKSAKKWTYVAIPLIVFATLIPTTQQIVIMTGGVGVLEASRTERAQEMASKSVVVIEKFLDEYLKEAEKPAK